MPIEGRTLTEAARKLQDHLNDLLVHTVTQTRLVVFSATGSNRADVSFRQANRPNPAALSASSGRVHLHFHQTCEGVPINGVVRLRTIKYRYTLTLGDAPEPILRWEYEKVPAPDKRACRHHVHVDLSGSPLRLRAHIPTGYTLVEDVIRFCINDLKVPHRSADWHDRLEESERAFKEEFASPDDRR